MNRHAAMPIFLAMNMSTAEIHPVPRTCRKPFPDYTISMSLAASTPQRTGKGLRISLTYLWNKA